MLAYHLIKSKLSVHVRKDDDMMMIGMVSADGGGVVDDKQCTYSLHYTSGMYSSIDSTKLCLHSYLHFHVLVNNHLIALFHIQSTDTDYINIHLGTTWI